MGGTVVTSGNINGVWTAANSPYRIVANSIATNLVIQPGVSVLFSGPYSLTVTGLLQAAGTSNNPVIFAGALPGIAWQGLRFVSANTNSILSNCVVQGAVACGLRLTNTPLTLSSCLIISNTGVSGGGIYTDSNLLLQNCSIVNNAAVAGQQASPYFAQGGGLYVAGGNTTLQSCLISNNTAVIPNIAGATETSTGGGVDCESGTLTLDECTVVSNTASAAGVSATELGGVYVNNVAASLAAAGSAFQGNSAMGGFGGAAAAGNAALLVCVFSGNQATFGGALWTGGSGQTMATNCIFSGNAAAQGGAVYSTAAGAAGDFENCTVVRNSPDAFNSFTGLIHDSILFFNGNEIVAGVIANPVVNYCDVQGGYAGTNNLDLAPDFAGAGNFELSETSPLTDAGDPSPQFNDAAFPPSQGEDANDLGAYGGPGAAFWPSALGTVPVIFVNGQAAAPSGTFALPASSPAVITFSSGFAGGSFEYTLDGSNPLYYPTFTTLPLVLTNRGTPSVIMITTRWLFP